VGNLGQTPDVSGEGVAPVCHVEEIISTQPLKLLGERGAMFV